MMDDERKVNRKEFSVCYDRFCIGRFSFCGDEDGKVVPFEELGAFEMYLLGMWNDGMVVTLKTYDEKTEQNQFILLLPDGSEQLMTYSSEYTFVVKHFRDPGKGRFAYLLEFFKGIEYKGYRGYEEYDEEEKMIIGSVQVGEETLTYGGRHLREVKEEFLKVVVKALR